MSILAFVNNASVLVGFVCSLGAVVVYGFGGDKWWKNSYGRMVQTRGVALTALYLKGFVAVLQGAVLSTALINVTIDILFGAVMVYSLVVNIRLVRQGRALRKLRKLENEVSLRDARPDLS